MTELTQKGLLAAWPVVLVVGNYMFSAGTINSEIESLKKTHDTMDDLVPRVAVLESQTDRMSADLVEIKEDIKVIRDFLLEGRE